MKIVYTAAALRDLEEIAEWLAVHYPIIAPGNVLDVASLHPGCSLRAPPPVWPTLAKPLRIAPPSVNEI